MAKKRISELPAGGALNGTELVPIVQTGTTKRITAQDIANLGNASGVEGSGTINYLAKFTATSTIGNSLIFDNGTSVGIGTATPSATYKLDIVGSVRATTIVKLGGTSAEYLKADGSVSTLTNPITGTGTTNYLPKFTGASALGNSIVSDNGTNVGIGTSSPRAKFSVISGTDNTGAFFPATNALIVGANNSLTSNSPNLAISSNSTAGIDVGASIGFGGLFLSPGDLRDLGFGMIKGAKETADAGNAQGYLAFGTYGSGGMAERMRITSGGDVQIGTSANVSAFGRTLTINGAITRGLLLQNNGTDSAYFYSDPNNLTLGSNAGGVALNAGGAERMRITSAGNVGIGLTAPSEKLEVQNAAAGAKIKVSNSSGGYATLECSSNATSVAQLSFTNQLTLTGGNVFLSNGLTASGEVSAVTRFRLNPTTQSNQIIGDGTASNLAGANNLLLRNDSGSIFFASGSANVQMLLNTSGNLLLGTTTDAGFKLDVNGTARVSGNFTATGTIVAAGADILGSSATSDYGNLTLRGGYAITTASASKIEIRGYEGGAATQGALMFYTNNTERLRISQAGAVTFKGGSTQNSLTLEAISGYGNGFYVFNGDGGLGNGFGIYNLTTSTLPFFIANNNAATFINSVRFGNLTTTQINALTPTAGMTIFNTTLATLCFYDGSGWRKVSHSNM